MSRHVPRFHVNFQGVTTVFNDYFSRVSSAVLVKPSSFPQNPPVVSMNQPMSPPARA